MKKIIVTSDHPLKYKKVINVVSIHDIVTNLFNRTLGIFGIYLSHSNKVDVIFYVTVPNYIFTVMGLDVDKYRDLGRNHYSHYMPITADNFTFYWEQYNKLRIEYTDNTNPGFVVKNAMKLRSEIIEGFKLFKPL